MKNEVYMSGTGNDFICSSYERDLSQIEIISIVGDSLLPIDGVIFIENCEESDFKMVYYNSDGRLGSFCGNGARCSAKFASDEKIISANTPQNHRKPI